MMTIKIIIDGIIIHHSIKTCNSKLREQLDLSRSLQSFFKNEECDLKVKIYYECDIIENLNTVS